MLGGGQKLHTASPGPEQPASCERLQPVEAQLHVVLSCMQVCPSASCINMDLFWFLEASGCVCASDTIQDISGFGATGAHPFFVFQRKGEIDNSPAPRVPAPVDVFLLNCLSQQHARIHRVVPVPCHAREWLPVQPCTEVAPRNQSTCVPSRACTVF